jgi:hypothetical protein
MSNGFGLSLRTSRPNAKHNAVFFYLKRQLSNIEFARSFTVCPHRLKKRSIDHLAKSNGEVQARSLHWSILGWLIGAASYLEIVNFISQDRMLFTPTKANGSHVTYLAAWSPAIEYL